MYVYKYKYRRDKYLYFPNYHPFMIYILKLYIITRSYTICILYTVHNIRLGIYLIYIISYRCINTYIWEINNCLNRITKVSMSIYNVIRKSKVDKVP